MDKLTEQEEAILIDVLEALDESFDEADEAQADYADCDENKIYISVSYGDGEPEDLKLNRSDLNSGDTPKEIASRIW